jgi:hypothetical protein
MLDVHIPFETTNEVGGDTEGVQVFSDEEQVEQSKIMEIGQRQRRDCPFVS